MTSIIINDKRNIRFSNRLLKGTNCDPILDSFVIKLNTIIRTSDSLGSGARYLSETETSSNQQCLLWCWDNRNCTLAVYEEKSQGSCYLFDCGPPEQMKCKFTGHDHYTSSLIKFNRNSVDGNTVDQRNQAKHENDLVNLRISSATSVKPISTSNNDSKGIEVTSTTSGSLSPPPSSGSTYTSTSASVKACKHHQFQCRNTSDCIAIYNVCDGIVQCSDGSDEAVDLHCPTESGYPSVESQVALPPSNQVSNRQRSPSSASLPVSTSTINFANPLDKNVGGRMDVKDNEAISVVGVEGGNGVGQFVPKKSVNAQAFNYPKSPDIVNDLKENGKMSMNSHKFDDYNPIRDKFETKPYYPSYGNQYYQPPLPPPPPSSHGDFYNGPRSRGFSTDTDYPNSFTRDYWQPENGIIATGGNVRSNNLDHNLINPIYHQYRPTNDIGSINVNNNGNGVPSPQSQPAPTLTRSIPWSKSSYLNSYQRKSTEFTNMEPVSRIDMIDTQGSGGGVNNELGVNIRQNNIRAPQEHLNSVRKIKNSQSLADDLKDHANKIETSTRSSPSGSMVPITSPSTAPTHTVQMTPIKGVSHLNSDKMSNEWALPVAVTHLSSSQSGRDTNSAVIALVLGVGITAMLVTLVGCRMKYIKRRIARRGRNLAHDADYLVNGMYL
uniref:MANSC domain-containing protein n=1 Tax=Tetranychus urticae TaxID=32264 RepID=T1KUI5_TETUR